MRQPRVGWVDATGGLSGDMLLGACLDAGVELAVVQAAVEALELPEPVTLSREAVRRGQIGATRAVVEVSASAQRRGLSEVLVLLENLEPGLRTSASAVFRALAHAEARVHQVPVTEVHFHEVGALDSIVDVVGVVAALHTLGLDRLVCSPIALGGGRAHSGHGPIPVPGPAVLELLAQYGAAGFGGPVDIELATPTGVALMMVLADDFGPLPLLRPVLVGCGAGSRDLAGHTNITRLVIGEAASTPDVSGRDVLDVLDVTAEPAVVLEANVDDLDPQLWPAVLSELLTAGASDAWLSPIVMKKGRPAHTVGVLAEPAHVEALERILFCHTTTIGVRRHRVDKRALPRESLEVRVHGGRIRVKIARLDGRVVNVAPEYDDVARVATEHAIPAKVVMNSARAAAEQALDSS